MTSEGMGEMFEGNSADTFAGKFPLISIRGLSGGARVRGHGSEAPHQRERNKLKLRGLNPNKKCFNEDNLQWKITSKY